MNSLTERTNVSVLIPAKNEISNIAQCIGSVLWADEIVVVDSSSTDGTIEAAEELGAKVVQFSFVPGGPKKKNWALERYPFSNAWVLIVDADERITDELAAEIKDVLLTASDEAGFYINRRFYFMGKWIRHSGYYPSWNLRLFRHDRGRYELVRESDSESGDNEVHEHVILDGKAGRLKCPMEHFAYPSIKVFVEKHNRYSGWEARVGKRSTASIGTSGSPIAQILNRRRLIKRVGRKIWGAHWFRFLYHFYLKLGCLDGEEGYIFCHLLAEYEFLIWAKGREHKS